MQTEIEPEKGERWILKQGFLTPDGSAARLGRRGTKQRESEKERDEEGKKERNHAEGNENAAEGACLSRSPSLAFISERVIFVITKRGKDCDMRVVSRVRK